MLQTGAGARVLLACYSCEGFCFSLSSSSRFPFAWTYQVCLNIGLEHVRYIVGGQKKKKKSYLHRTFFLLRIFTEINVLRLTCVLFDAVGTEKLSAHVGVKRRVYGHARMFVVSATLERTFTSHNEKTRKRYVNICRQGKARL